MFRPRSADAAGEQLGQEDGRAGALEPQPAHVRDVGDARPRSRDRRCSSMIDVYWMRHAPAGKVDHPPAVGDVPVVQRRSAGSREIRCHGNVGCLGRFVGLHAGPPGTSDRPAEKRPFYPTRRHDQGAASRAAVLHRLCCGKAGCHAHACRGRAENAGRTPHAHGKRGQAPVPRTLRNRGYTEGALHPSTTRADNQRRPFFFFACLPGRRCCLAALLGRRPPAGMVFLGALCGGVSAVAPPF